jgi:hypothetical protein
VDYAEEAPFHNDLVPRNDRQLACQVTLLPLDDAHVLPLPILGHTHNRHIGNTILLHMQGPQLKMKMFIARIDMCDGY